MKYVEYINLQIRKEIGKEKRAVLFGQNIGAGSCLGGLTRGIIASDSVHVINTPNIENTQVGIGYGMMLNGVSSVFFMKQQDFLLLGIDQLANTYNFVRQYPPKASFTIVAIVVDLGYQGMQSSLNNLGDFCSIANIPGYSVTNRYDADYIIENHLFAKGFRLIGVSQRLFGQEVIVPENSEAFAEGATFQYSRGMNCTIACFNFSLPQGLQLDRSLQERGLDCSLFSVNTALSGNWEAILADLQTTGRLIVLDDSKSVNRACYQLAARAHEVLNGGKVLVLTRQKRDDWLSPNDDEFHVDFESVIQFIC